MSARAGPPRALGDAVAAHAAKTSSTDSDGGGVGQGGSGNGPNSKKRSRVSRACDACFSRKDRCDGGHPVCKMCHDLDRECTYDRPERKRGPLQGVRQRVEAQNEILESILGFVVETFPTISQEILRHLKLDDGAAAMVKAESDVHRESPSATTATGALRLPLGNIYPRCDKAGATEAWRRSDLAKSIAPSLGLRLGLLDDDEDIMDPNVHQARVEEARHARVRLLMSAPQGPFVREHHINTMINDAHARHIQFTGSAYDGSPPYLAQIQPAPMVHNPPHPHPHPHPHAHAQAQHAAVMQHIRAVEAAAVQHVLDSDGAPVLASTAPSSMSEPSAVQHDSRGMHGEVVVDMDPFSAQYDTFLGNPAEESNALAYALGLPNPSGGGHHAHSTFPFNADPPSAGTIGTSADEGHAKPSSTPNSIPSVFANAYVDEAISPPMPLRSSYTYAEHGGGSGGSAFHAPPSSSTSHFMLSSLTGGGGGDGMGGQATAGAHSSPVGGRTMHSMDVRSGDGSFDAGVLHIAHPSPSQHSHNPHQPRRAQQAPSVLYQLGLQDSL